MTTYCYHIHENRAVMSVAGEARVGFLQGLVSADVEMVSEDKACWAAYLTPQGKYLHDFFIFSDTKNARILLDCEGGERFMNLGRALRRHVLRADVQLNIVDDFSIVSFWKKNEEFTNGFQGTNHFIHARDPRHGAMGMRIVGPRSEIISSLKTGQAVAVSPTDWDQHRIALGIPDGSRDMQPEKTLLLECGFDELGGIDWQKGCYVGQEVTARMKYRGLLKKRLFPVQYEGNALPCDSPVMAKGVVCGHITSSAPGCALALLKIDTVIQSLQMTAAGRSIVPAIPEWMKLTERSS